MENILSLEERILTARFALMGFDDLLDETNKIMGKISKEEITDVNKTPYLYCLNEFVDRLDSRKVDEKLQEQVNLMKKSVKKRILYLECI